MDADVLYANLEHLAALSPPAVRPTLPPLPGGGGPLPGDFQPSAPAVLLQVNAVEDVSLPLLHRLRAMAPRGEPLAEAAGELLQPPEDDAAPRRGRRQRCLRLALTDGFTRVVAVEDVRGGCEALRDGVAWGAKIRVAAPFVVRHGVLVLTSHGTEMLGGGVAELQAFWERYAVDALARLSGRPQRRIDVTKEAVQGAEGEWERGNGNSASHPDSSLQQQQSIVPQQQQQQQLSALPQQHQQQSILPQQQQQSLHPQQQPLSALPQQHQQQSLHPQQYQQQSILPQQQQQSFHPQQQPLSALPQQHQQQSLHPQQHQQQSILPQQQPQSSIQPLHRSVPALPIVSSRPSSPQPLGAWASHHPSTVPFTTTAVIVEVTSELTIREADEQYSLLVLLAPPNSADGEEDGLVVDLGHAWLRRALGMDPVAFRALSTSRRPEDIARLGEIVEAIGNALEKFGEAIFVLRLRAVDGVVEVIETRRPHQ